MAMGLSVPSDSFFLLLSIASTRKLASKWLKEKNKKRERYFVRTRTSAFSPDLSHTKKITSLCSLSLALFSLGQLLVQKQQAARPGPTDKANVLLFQKPRSKRLIEARWVGPSYMTIP